MTLTFSLTKRQTLYVSAIQFSLSVLSFDFKSIKLILARWKINYLSLRVEVITFTWILIKLIIFLMYNHEQCGMGVIEFLVKFCNLK